MKTVKLTFISTIFVAALGLAPGLAAAPAMADKPVCPGHPHGCGDGDEDPPTLDPCAGSVCIADVGKASDNTAARQYAEDPSHNYDYIKIGSKDFDKILETLTEGDPATALCNAYDVLIFNWASITIKKLNWQRLLDYMNCRGNVIFEDPRNVANLAPDVSTIETTLHSRGDFPLAITLLQGPINGTTETTLPFVNKHIIFDDNSGIGLLPFLSLANGDVVGLYGEFPGDGRIVLTGPDNNFHGDNDPYFGDPEAEAKINHYDLLSNEIDWLLDGG